jgi:glutaredoxin 3
MKEVKSVTVFSTTWCPYCKVEEEWLKSEKIDHKVVLIDEDATAAMYIVDKTGQRGVPVTEVVFQDDSAEYVIGFDKAKLKPLLKADS